jgi:hypothetical protein
MFAELDYNPLASLVIEAQNQRNPKELRIRIHCLLMSYAYAKPKPIDEVSRDLRVVNVNTNLDNSDGGTNQRAESNPKPSAAAGERS